MPRVTEVLDYLTEPELISYIENNSKAKREAIRKEAFRIGSTVDSLVQQDINDGGYLEPVGDEPVNTCLRAWELFKKDHPEFVPMVSSMQTELKQGELVGHLDFLMKDKKNCRWGVVDLKCASSIRPKYWTQTGKYCDMVKHNLEPLLLLNHEVDMPRFIGVLRLDKTTGLYEYKIIEDEDFIQYENTVFEAYYTAFNHAMNTREQLRQALETELLGGSR